MARLMVSDARNLANMANKDYVVIIAVGADGTQFVTWGRSPEDKVRASDLAAHLGETLCGPPQEVFEDFKLDAAKNKANVETLTAALTELAEAGAEAWGEDRPCVERALAVIAQVKGGP